MANGNNKLFLSNPIEFMDRSVYMAADNAFEQNNVYNIDLVGMDNMMNLEKYDNRVHRCGARPVRAYFLRSVPNAVSELDVNLGAGFLFTPMLTGCMFAVYGEDNTSVKAIHVNALDGSMRIRGKIEEIRGEYANRFYRILCRRSDADGIPDKFVYTYNFDSAQNAEQTLVFGMRTNNEWHFYKKPAKIGEPLVEM